MEYIKPKNLSIYNRVHDYKILIIGTGGTGSILADNIAKINFALINSDKPGIRLSLVDPDIVEAKNIGRQNFYANELGMKKTDAIAQRLSRNYLMRNIVSCPKKIELSECNVKQSYDIVICCVDNYKTREWVYEHFHKYTHILDIGNEKDFGQIILSYKEELMHTFDIFTKKISKTQNKESDYQCDNYEQQFEKQSLFINTIIAGYAAELLRDFISSDTIDYNCIFVNLNSLKTTKALKTWQ